MASCRQTKGVHTITLQVFSICTYSVAPAIVIYEEWGMNEMKDTDSLPSIFKWFCKM